MSKNNSLFATLNADFASGLVVFLVALPLCLGIALASGAPLFSGIISGVIGGIVVGSLSQSHISVTGPAAGLTAIIASAVIDLGSFEILLLAVFLAGIFQLLLGFLKAGAISNYFPTNVIEGMLAGIGVIIFLKQIPHAVGYDNDFEGDLNFFQSDGKNTFTELFELLDHFQLGSVYVTLLSLVILISWTRIDFLKKIKVVPPALIAVIAGVLINYIFCQLRSPLEIKEDHLVNLPIPKSISEFKNILQFPDFNAIANSKIWIVAVTIAVVASVETLLCIEAADRMDAQKRYTNTNMELKAQGIGNILSALLGGLPMTSVVVRSSANNSAGAKSKMSAILHGVLLLTSALSIPSLLNKIPLATLAAVLLLVGYKLANPKIIKHFYQKGKYQFIPFIATLLAVVFTDLLRGVALGMVLSIIFILKGNMKRAYTFNKESYHKGDIIHIELAQEVSFLNKAAIKATLSEIPDNATVTINAANTVYIAHDVLDLIKEFSEVKAIENNIKVRLSGFKKEYDLANTGEEEKHVFVEHL